MSSVPIADHALLSDCHSAALVTTGGSVDWLCFPRFDSPSVFARLLDEEAGHWVIRPVGGAASVSRRYAGRTLVLETTFSTATGVVVLTDALAMGPDDSGHRLGAGAPHLLVRSVRCAQGRADIEVEYVPRPEYGLTVPLLSPVEGGVLGRGGGEYLVLSSPVPMEVSHGRACARVSLEAGGVARFALHRSASAEQAARVWTQEEIAARLEDTLSAWQSWSALHQSYRGPWRDLVHHSGRVLQALTYQPSGAVIAAATTSLPEAVGGTRNWDYRFSWVRDASFTLEALWVAACPDEADGFFSFMAAAAAGSLDPGRSLQIVFGVGGEHDLAERELPHLAGWRGSRPVRVGNGAWSQRQIDVYGELLSAAARLAHRFTDLDASLRGFLVALADAAAARWREPDQGIWEVRGEPRHFLHSKVMCWVALDRAVALAGRLGAEDRVGEWTATRDEIRETVLRDGWCDAAGAYTRSFGSADLDAALLMMPIVGFLPADDPRMLATVDAIAERLTDERGLVRRYQADDGVEDSAGPEGTFLLCTFWLAHALAMAGRVGQARGVFERAAGFANDVGLLAEEVDTVSGALLGNFPQAFSHIGLVNAAWAVAEAEERAGGGNGGPGAAGGTAP